MQVNFKVRGIEELQTWLKKLPYGTIKVALQAFTEYVIGNESRGLKHPDPYKYVTRTAAYGFPFFTDKQRRWFFLALDTGQIDPGKNNRTGRSESAWQYVMTSAYTYKITNPEPGAYFTRDDYGQARQPALVGWRKIIKVIMDNFAGGIRSASAAVSAYLKTKGSK